MKNYTFLVYTFLALFIQSCNNDDNSNNNPPNQLSNIGHTTIIFNDEERNRNIETEIYYPSIDAGEDVDIKTGNYPIIIIGHGFLMEWSSYQTLWEELVDSGYIVCFPTTEMSFSPNHESFGIDLKFIASIMQSQNENENSIFFNSIISKTALLGHSMGGGAVFLGAENNSNINTIVSFAAAETNPSAIAAAANINIPTLVFSGDDDCVAPPNEHQNLMFENLNSECKTHIKIINGGHCYFADSNVSCNLGESFCNSDLNISRESQQNITYSFLKQWLNYILYEDQDSFDDFNNTLETSTLINYLQFCN